jgi:putative ABC transport system permease protein
MTPPDNAGYQQSIALPGSENRKATVFKYMVDYDFFKTMGIGLKSGSDFSKDDTLSKGPSIIVNQELLDLLKISDISKARLEPFKIKAVVNEFNISSLHDSIKPSLFQLNPAACLTMIVRFSPDREEQVIAAITNSWNRLAPTLPLSYRFFDQELRDRYDNDRNFARVVASFTFLAFIITGMGLFGLALLLTEQKRKEVAIRKVFGASNMNIIYQMQKDFYLYIAVATLIAIPASWYALEKWLGSYIYRVSLPWYIFVVSTLAVTLFVSSIILFRTRKVLKENPMNALKYE